MFDPKFSRFCSRLYAVVLPLYDLQTIVFGVTLNHILAYLYIASFSSQEYLGISKFAKT